MDVVADDLPVLHDAALKVSIPLSSLLGGRLVRSEHFYSSRYSASFSDSHKLYTSSSNLLANPAPAPNQNPNPSPYVKHNHDRAAYSPGDDDSDDDSFHSKGEVSDSHLMMASPQLIRRELSKGSLIVSRQRQGQGQHPVIVQAAGAVDKERVYCVWRWRLITEEESRRRETTGAEAHLKGTPESLARRLTELRCLAGRVWLKAAQAATVALEFPDVPVTSSSSSGANHLTYRQCAVITLFPRVIDLENVNILVDTLPRERHAPLYDRIGWLNALNIFKLNRYFNLDLSIHDNWQVAEIIVKLVLCKGGAKLQGEQFRRNRRRSFIPGWEIPAPWLPETYKGNLPKGIPREGVLLTHLVSQTEPPRNWRKVRQLIMRQFTLLGVPRGDGRDLHMPASAAASVTATATAINSIGISYNVMTASSAPQPSTERSLADLDWDDILV
jgi:hypothetical protein